MQKRSVLSAAKERIARLPTHRADARAAPAPQLIAGGRRTARIASAVFPHTTIHQSRRTDRCGGRSIQKTNSMKIKSYFPRVALVLALFMGACSDSSDVDTPDTPDTPDPPAAAPVLKVSPASLSFKAEGETLELTVEAENVAWKADPADDWLTLSGGGSGDGSATVKVTAAPNKKTEKLTSSIVFTGKGVDPVNIAVTQEAAQPAPQPSLEVSPASLSFEAEGGTLELTVEAKDVAWKAASETAWLTLTGGSGSGNAAVQVKADPNTSATPLTATIVFTGEGVDPVSIAVTQKAKVDPVQPVELKYAEAYWAGDYWDTAGSLNDLYIILTDMTFQNGAMTYPGKIIQIDLNIPATTFDKVETVVANTYTPSYSLTPLKSYTFNSDEVSYIWEYDASGAKIATHYTTGGSVKIARSGSSYTIDLDLTMDDNTTFVAQYSGTMVFYDDTIKHLSTLDRSVQPSLTQANGTFYSYTDASIASRALKLDFYGDLTQSKVDNMMLMLNVAPQAQKEGAIEGVYTVIEKEIDKIATSDLVAGTAVPGYLTKDDQGELAFGGSWYRLLANVGGQSQLGGMAPLTSGRVVIERQGEIYTVTYQFVDDNAESPHAVTGTYTGPIAFTNLEGGDPDPGPGPGPDPKPQVDASTGGQLSQWKPGGRW